MPLNHSICLPLHCFAVVNLSHHLHLPPAVRDGILATRGDRLCFVLLALITLTQFGVSVAEAFNTVDNRIMTVVAFVLSVGSTCLWGRMLDMKMRAYGFLTYSDWSPFVAQVILGLLKFVSVLYQFKLGAGGDNPFITDYSYVPLMLGIAASLFDSRDDDRNDHHN